MCVKGIITNETAAQEYNCLSCDPCMNAIYNKYVCMHVLGSSVLSRTPCSPGRKSSGGTVVCVLR